MITEDYVSFEVAKLLKEKGYWNIATMLYKENGDIVNYNVPLNNKGFSSTLGVFYEAPTLQSAMKWLREVHNFNVNIELTIHGYFCSLSHIVRDSLGYIIDIEDSEAWETAYYDSYEEACESAIRYTLENLI